ncbi:MAG: VanZ family protein [Microgenomates group bacterium]
MEKLKRAASLWLPVAIWMGVIFTFSSMQVGSSSDFYWKDFIVKKTAHLVEYGILATLFYRGLINSNIEKKRAMWYSVLLAFMYGLTDEFHQSFTPGRGPKFTDVLIDTTGAMIFVFGIILNIKKMPETVQKVYSKYQIK